MTHCQIKYQYFMYTIVCYAVVADHQL